MHVSSLFPRIHTATYPLDVVRRRMQTSGCVPNGSVEGALYGQGGPSSQARGLPKNATMLQILEQVYTNEGFRGLFKGLSMNWIKVISYYGLYALTDDDDDDAAPKEGGEERSAHLLCLLLMSFAHSAYRVPLH